MSGLHPQYMLSKRFPVHAAIELQDLKSIASLLGNERDARYHLDRKLTNNEVSVLHQACCARPTAKRHWVDIVRLCLKLGANVNDVDCIGQTPLFYAISHCQALEIVPILIQAGSMINQARWLDGWTALHVSAMMGLERVVDILLNAGADPVLASSDGMNASQIAMKHNYKKIAEKIRTCKNRIKNESQIEKKENELENISIFKPNNLIKPQPDLPSSLQKSNDNGMEEMGDEVAWALQMKRDLEEKKRKENELSNKRKNEEEDKNNNTKSTKVAVGTKRMTQEQKLKELKQKMEEEEKQKNNPSQAEQMVNILDVMEKKRQRRMAAKSKMSEKERLEKEKEE